MSGARNIAAAVGALAVGAAVFVGAPAPRPERDAPTRGQSARVSKARPPDYMADRSHVGYYECPRPLVLSTIKRSARKGDSPHGSMWACGLTSAPPCTTDGPPGRRTCIVTWRAACAAPAWAATCTALTRAEASVRVTEAGMVAEP